MKMRPRVANKNSLKVSISSDGYILLVEGPVLNLLGYKADELIEMNFRELVSENDRMLVEEIIGNHTERCEFGMVRKDGSHFYADAFVFDQFTDEGVAEGSCLRIFDATARIAAIHNLLESEEKYRAISENIRDMVCIFRKGKILYVNSVLEKVLGYEASELFELDYMEGVNLHVKWGNYSMTSSTATSSKTNRFEQTVKITSTTSSSSGSSSSSGTITVNSN